MLFDRARSHARIAGYLIVETKSRLLSLAGGAHSFPDRGGGFPWTVARDMAVVDRRDFDMQINPVEERAGNALPITLHLDRAATAFARST